MNKNSNVMKDKIEAIVKHYQITQKEFGKKIGVTPATVTMWIKGQTLPTANHEKRIALVFSEINIYWLFGLNEPMIRGKVEREINRVSLESLKNRIKYLEEKVKDQKKIIELLETDH